MTSRLVVCPQCQQKTPPCRLSYNSLTGEHVALQKCLACGRIWSTADQAAAEEDARTNDQKAG